MKSIQEPLHTLLHDSFLVSLKYKKDLERIYMEKFLSFYSSEKNLLRELYDINIKARNLSMNRNFLKASEANELQEIIENIDRNLKIPLKPQKGIFIA